MPGDVGRAGMHAEARLVVPAGAPAYYLPKAVVRRTRGEHGIFVVRDGTAHWVTVQVREVYHRPELWHIVDGDLREGDAVVTRGYSGLRYGAVVEAEADE